MEEKKITVIGSCVCRDLFEKDPNNFSFYTDIRFSSPISMMAKPVEFIKADFDCFPKNVKTVGGNWYKKNLINDINKTVFSALKEKHGDYLILDFAESRISLAEISWPNNNETLLVTNSVSFRAHYQNNLKNNILKNVSIKTISPLEYDDEYWSQIIRSFANNLLEIFDEDKIILIKNMPARHYIDCKGYLHPYYSNDHFNSILLCDLLIEKLNKIFISFCPHCKVIDIPPYAIGTQTHKWGNHPFHFTDVYYEYLLKCVQALVLNNNEKEVASLFLEYSNKFKEQYDESMKKSALAGSKGNERYSIVDLLDNYEEYNMLGRKQKALILFALDKKHFIKNFNKMKKSGKN